MPPPPTPSSTKWKYDLNKGYWEPLVAQDCYQIHEGAYIMFPDERHSYKAVILVFFIAALRRYRCTL